MYLLLVLKLLVVINFCDHNGIGAREKKRYALYMQVDLNEITSRLILNRKKITKEISFI